MITAFLIVASCVALGVGLGWIAPYMTQQRRLDRDARLLRSGRKLLDNPLKLRAPRSDDQELVSALDSARSELDALAPRFVVLGDLVVDAEHLAADVISRCFVSDDGVVAAFLFFVRSDSGSGHGLSMETYSDVEQIVTARTDLTKGLLRPPFVHKQRLPTTTTVDDMLAKHREHIATVQNTAFVQMKTLEQVVEQLLRWHALEAEWRLQMDPDALLAKDVEALGPHSSSTQRGLVNRLSSHVHVKVPEARVLKGGE